MKEIETAKKCVKGINSVLGNCLNDLDSRQKEGMIISFWVWSFVFCAFLFLSIVNMMRH